jgi:hypothetical protein
MAWRYLDLADFLLVAEAVLEIPAEDLARAGRLELAESALHAPTAEFGGVELAGVRIPPSALHEIGPLGTSSGPFSLSWGSRLKACPQGCHAKPDESLGRRSVLLHRRRRRGWRSIGCRRGESVRELMIAGQRYTADLWESGDARASGEGQRLITAAVEAFRG